MFDLRKTLPDGNRQNDEEPSLQPGNETKYVISEDGVRTVHHRSPVKQFFSALDQFCERGKRNDFWRRNKNDDLAESLRLTANERSAQGIVDQRFDSQGNLKPGSVLYYKSGDIPVRYNPSKQIFDQLDRSADKVACTIRFDGTVIDKDTGQSFNAERASSIARFSQRLTPEEREEYGISDERLREDGIYRIDEGAKYFVDLADLLMSDDTLDIAPGYSLNRKQIDDLLQRFKTGENPESKLPHGLLNVTDHPKLTHLSSPQTDPPSSVWFTSVLPPWQAWLRIR